MVKWCPNVRCSTASFLFFQLWVLVGAGFFTERTIYIPSFKYEMCNKKVYDGRHSFWFRDLDIMATAYGDVDFTGSFVTTHNMTSPLKVTLNLKRSVLGVNIKIPCIKNFGSCTYSDICVFGYRDEESCPPILDENDVPCRCPIEPSLPSWTRLCVHRHPVVFQVYKAQSDALPGKNMNATRACITYLGFN